MAKKKVNVSNLKKRKPPLAKVVQIILDSRTTRDVGTADLSKDIGLMLQARNASTPLAKALSELEQEMLKTEEKAILKDLDEDDK